MFCVDESVNVEDVISLLRIQKHDILNHLQVVHGFLQLNKAEMAKSYLKNAIDQIQQRSSVLKVQSPYLVATLCIAREKGEQRGIDVNIQVEETIWENNDWSERVAQLLNIIFKKLLHNEKLTKGQMITSFITESERNCIIEIRNCQIGANYHERQEILNDIIKAANEVEQVKLYLFTENKDVVFKIC